MPSLPSGISARLGLLGLFVLLWIQIHWVADTNFGGFDEWVVLDLNAQGIVSVPHANRPLGTVWSLPASLLWARGLGLRPFALLHGLYLLLSAALLHRLCVWLARPNADLAFLVPAFFLVWAPGDLARLSTIERVLYGGITFGTLACLAGLVESWFRRSIPMLAAACVGALLVSRTYEGVLAVLAGAPLLIPGEWRSRRFLAWVAAWEAVVAAGLALALRSILAFSGEPAYQLAVLKPEWDPRTWLARMAWQYAYHLAPIVVSPLRELWAPAVALAAGVFLAAFALRQRGRESAGIRDRPFLAGGLVMGLGFAGLGYSLIVLGTAAPTAFRLQFLSGPGMALGLASGVALLGTLVPARWRGLLVGGLAAWLVAVGTGRTLAMQRTWDQRSFYWPQTRLLGGLLAAAPDVRPHTLIVLLDDTRAWQTTFAFRHAAQRLYGGRAEGFVPNVWNALYPVRFAADGVYFEPWPVVRESWRCGPGRYDYDELLVLHASAAGAVALVDSWPPLLPPLPAGAHYAPRLRLETARPAARPGP